MTKERVLLKIGGESFSGEGLFGYDKNALEFVGEEILSVENSHEISIVVGGGNFIRGAQLKKEIFERDTVVADYIGMLMTVANAILLEEFFKIRFNLKVVAMSALEVRQVCEPYIFKKAHNHLAKERINIIGGGIGRPDFSTDTSMVIMAHELGAGVVLKGTKVDGIFDRDPKNNPEAKFIPEISYLDYLNRGLQIIDSSAVTKAMEHGIKIVIFNFFKKGNLKRVLVNHDIGSVIKNIEKDSES